MAIPATIDTLADAPEHLRGDYTALPDGRWALTLDGTPSGFVPKKEHDTFRDNNRSLNRKVSELEEQLKSRVDATAREQIAELTTKLKAFDGVDLDEYRRLKEQPDLSAEVVELKTALAAAQSAKAVAQASADAAVFRSKIADAFLSTGGRTEALDFIVSKAEKTFAMKDGALSSQEFSVDRPGETLSLSEWVAARTRDAAFAFKESGGGGARNTGGGHGKKVISSDPLDVGRHLEGIAKGDVVISR